jgi:hypothetical protein
VTAAPPRGQSTARLVAGDPDRSPAAVWSAAGGLRDGEYVLISKTGVRTPVPRLSIPRAEFGGRWSTQWHGAFRCPADLKPGDYLLDAGRGPEYPFRVVAASPLKKPKALSTVTADTLRAALTPGADVRLPAGEFEVDGTVALPAAACRLRGVPGATVLRPTLRPAEYNSRLFLGGKDFTLEGVTVVGPDGASPWAQVFHAGPWSGSPGEDNTGTTGTGFVLRDCTFRRANLGYNLSEPWVVDVTFENAGATDGGGSGLWVRPRFLGLPVNVPHAFRPRGVAGNLAVYDAAFEGTDRGPCFLGDVEDALFYGTRLRNIAGEENGSESFLAEGQYRFDRVLILNTRSTGGAGPVVQIEAGVTSRDCVVADFQVDGPGPTHLLGACTGWQLWTCEWRGGYLHFGPAAAGNVARQASWHWRGPSRLNQGGWAQPSFDRKAAVAAEAPGNRIEEGHWFVGAGLMAFNGPIEVATSKINGVPFDYAPPK